MRTNGTDGLARSGVTHGCCRLPTASARRAAVLIAVASLAAGGSAYSQDAQYWTIQYGPVSELQGGVVVGSPLDLSATFYNPGALSLYETSSFLSSVRAFELRDLTVTDVQERGFEVKQSTTGPSPSLLAGTFPSRWLGEANHLAYSVLVRQDFDIRLNGRLAAFPEGETNLIRPQTFEGELLLDQRLTEIWGGLTWSRKLGDRMGFGLTPYFAYRGQRTRAEALARGISTSDEAASSVLIDDFDYSHFRALAKLGLAVNLESLTLGLTVTTPSVGLFGSGQGAFTRTAVGFEVEGDGVSDHVFAGDFQDDLPSEYRSPWSVAAGASYGLGRARLHASVEWFASVGLYQVLDVEPFADPRGRSFFPRLAHELDSVLNVGVALEHRLSENVGAHIAFHTDRSAAVPDTTTRHSLSWWDINHVSGGVALVLGSTELTLGVALATGSETIVPAISLEVDQPQPVVTGTPSPFEAKYRRLKILLGLSLGR
jgi:hypothetical protein